MRSGRVGARQGPLSNMHLTDGHRETPDIFNLDRVCAMGGATERDRMTEIATTLQPDDAINI